MAYNPLQKFFRQPKVYVDLPSKGIYCPAGTIEGDVSRLPVFGMTGMDEILLKTPDALLSGESTVAVIASCCPQIKDPWNLSILDIDVILTAIRIATYGSELPLSHICKNCQTENEFNLDLNQLIDHYSNCKYNNTIKVNDLTITVRPLSYQQSTKVGLKNFEIQQKLKQIASIEDQTAQRAAATEIFKELASLKHEIYTLGIESISIDGTIVTEKEFIREWIDNCEKHDLDVIGQHLQNNQENWTNPTHHVKCSNCGTETDLVIELDQSSFFENA